MEQERRGGSTAPPEVRAALADVLTSSLPLAAAAVRDGDVDADQLYVICALVEALRADGREAVVLAVVERALVDAALVERGVDLVPLATDLWVALAPDAASVPWDAQPDLLEVSWPASPPDAPVPGPVEPTESPRGAQDPEEFPDGPRLSPTGRPGPDGAAQALATVGAGGAVGDEPAADEPAADEPAADEPATSRSAGGPVGAAGTDPAVAVLVTGPPEPHGTAPPDPPPRRRRRPRRHPPRRPRQTGERTGTPAVSPRHAFVLARRVVPHGRGPPPHAPSSGTRSSPGRAGRGDHAPARSGVGARPDQAR